jgi:hypothetical protein
MEWTPISAGEMPDTPCAMQQHPNYAAACRLWGRNMRLLALRSANGATVATAQAVRRRFPVVGSCALVGRGPVWHGEVHDRSAAATSLMLRLRDQNLAALVIPDGADCAPNPPCLQVMTAGHVAEWDLRPSMAERRAGLHGKWRNRLVKAEAAGLAVESALLPAEPDYWLLRAEAAQARARGYRGLPPAFCAAWAVATPGAAWVFTARARGETIAAILVLLHPPAASYHIGWTSPAGRTASAHHLLLWRAAAWLAERGIARFDLGTLETEDSPGLARFKLGTGARARRLDGTWLAAPGTGIFGRLAGGAAQSIHVPSGQKA